MFLGLATILIIALSYFFYIKKDGDFVKYILPTGGTLVTVTALGFSIYQQTRLQHTASLIEHKTKMMHEGFNRDYHSWSIKKAINLTNEIEGHLNSEQPNVSAVLTLIKLLKEYLTECKNVYTIDILNELRDRCRCHDGKDVALGKIELGKVLDECMEKCKGDCIAKLKKFNDQLSTYYNGLQKINFQDGNSSSILVNTKKHVFNLRNLLIEIQPLPHSFALN